MKKTYKLKDLDCAACGAKMERAIRKLDGVQDATVNFIAQKLTITADEERIDELAEKAAAVCRKIEPNCRLER